MQNIIKIIIAICVFMFFESNYDEHRMAKAELPKHFALTNHARAAYQVCLEYSIPIKYEELEAKDNAKTRDPLNACANLLSAIGFQLRIDKLSFEDFKNVGKPVVLIANDRIQVAKIQDNRCFLFEYPHSPKLLELPEAKPLFPCLSVIIDSPPEVDVGNSTIRIYPFCKDFGVIEEGEIAKETFEIKNPHDKTINIIGLETTCGCTIVEGGLGTILPKNSKRFTVSFNSKDKWGYQEYLCLVRSDYGQAIFKLSGFVRTSGGYYPKTIDFGNVPFGTSSTTKIIQFLSQTDNNDSPIISVKAQEPISYKIDHGFNKQWGVKEDIITIQVSPKKLSLGSFETTLDIKYRHAEGSREAKIPIRWKVIDKIRQYLTLTVSDVGNTVVKDVKVPIMEGYILEGVLVKDMVDGLRMSTKVTDKEKGTIELKVTSEKSGVLENEIECIAKNGATEVIYIIHCIVATGKEDHHD